jgi:hypothetical protein
MANIVRRVPIDPYKVQGLVEKIVSKKDNLIYKKNETIYIIPKDLNNGPYIHKLIYEKLVSEFPISEFKEWTDGDIKKIRSVSNGKGGVYTQCPKKKNPSVLGAGRAYELYFYSVIMDGLVDIKDLRKKWQDIPNSIFNMYNNLTVVVTSKSKRFPIGPIISVDDVAGKNEKSDITITTLPKNGKNKFKISLKQSNFFSWGSAGTFNEKHSARAKKILLQAISQEIVSLDTNDENRVIFPSGMMGLRCPATDDEINYYCFGSGDNTADYIIINAKGAKYDNPQLIHMEAERVYKRGKQSDLNELRSDVYLVVYESKSNSTALSPYKNLSVQFVNKKHAYNGDIKTKKKYIPIDFKD